MKGSIDGARAGRRARWFAAGILSILVTTAGRADGPRTFFERFFDRDVQVITVTDKTPQGRMLRVPSKAHPLYYEAVVIGYQDFGGSTAGLDVPPKREMLKLFLKLLADQGYYPATTSHAPEMLIAVAWGTMKGRMGMALPFMGGDKLDVLWELEPLSIHTAARHLTRHLRSQTADFVVDCAQGDLYVISIQAFDEAAALQGKTRLLWHTKVSCPSQGLALTPSLKQMAREAAPFIGRETAKPVWTTAPPREGRVDLGELRTLELIDPDKLPVTDVEDGPDALGPAAAQLRKGK